MTTGQEGPEVFEGCEVKYLATVDHDDRIFKPLPVHILCSTPEEAKAACEHNAEVNGDVFDGEWDDDDCSGHEDDRSRYGDVTFSSREANNCGEKFVYHVTPVHIPL